EFSEASKQLASDPMRLAEAFGIRRGRLDGNDVLAVHAAAVRAVAQLRSGEGPVLLECKTTRMRGHYEGDSQKYRPPADIEAATRADPLARCEAVLRELGVSEDAIAQAARGAADRVDAAVARARAGALPSMAAALADVYSPAHGVSA